MLSKPGSYYLRFSDTKPGTITVQLKPPEGGRSHLGIPLNATAPPLCVVRTRLNRSQLKWVGMSQGIEAPFSLNCPLIHPTLAE